MFNQRKNKKFSYNSRFSKDEDKDLQTKNIKQEVTSEWKRTRKTGAKKGKFTLPLLLVLLGIIIAIMYYLEFKL